jgi:hypothetical protein
MLKQTTIADAVGAPPPIPPTLDAIVAKLGLFRFSFADEYALQRGILEALSKSGWEPEREVILSARDRIDFLVGDVGIEVKVAGGTASVLSQMARYAAHARIGSLLLVTSRHAHIRSGFPETFNGKPARAISLATGRL